VSYALGQHALTTAQADRDLGWTKAKLHRYWAQRAQACQQFADEGECLAQVARHAPVTIGGMGSTATDVSTVINVAAGLLSNPEATLRARGPALVNAIDRQLLDPLMDRMARKLAPYVLKYVLPPLSVLYVLSGIAAYYSHETARGGRVKANRRRRRTSRRTSRRRARR